MENNLQDFNEDLWCLKRDPKDNLNLTEVFNNYIKGLYSSLLVFSNEEVLNKIYKDLYDYGVIALNKSIEENIKGSKKGRKNINQKKFKELLALEIEFYINNMYNYEMIDFFSEDWVFSKLELTEMQKDILDASIGAIIARSDSEVARKSKRNRMCKRYNISNLRYNIETAKLSKMIVELVYSNGNDLESEKRRRLGK